MKRNQKITGLLLALCLLLQLALPVFADDSAAPGEPTGYITMSVERFILGQGYIKEPMRMPIYEGDNIAKITDRFLEGDENYTNKGTLESGFYLSHIKDGASQVFADAISPPQYLMDELGKLTSYDWDLGTKVPDPWDRERLVNEGRKVNLPEPGIEWLGEFCYYENSGWMYSQNNVFNNYGVASAIPKDGDVIRWQFTLYGYGRDIGGGQSGGKSLITPANKDALTGLLGMINADEDKERILAISGMDAAMEYAMGRLQDLEASQTDVDTAYQRIMALLEGSPEPGDPEPGALEQLMTAPEQISGAEGTEFNLVIKTKGWSEDPVKLIDGVINIPDHVEVVDVAMSDKLSGGALNYHLADGKLRFAYLSQQDLQDLVFTADAYPAELMTIKLRLTTDLEEETALEFSVETSSLKESSSKEALQFIVTEATASTTALPSSGPTAVTSRVLYQGDDSDLIPADKKAVALDFVNLNGAPKIALDEAELLYSPEMSEKHGTVTYVALLDAAVAEEALNDVESYTVGKGESEEIRFADTNNDDVVNAQDALNTLSAWLRKSDAPQNQEILVMNVTADPRIDTYDVLSIMEHYIDGEAFAVIEL